jgi:NADH-quinone oxidoreductase subunit F
MPDDIDLTPLQSLLDSFEMQGRSALLPALHATQNLYTHIPAAAAAVIAARLGIPEKDVNEVIDFYPLLHRQASAKTVIQVCSDPVCVNAGAEGYLKMLSQRVEELRAAGQEIGALTIEYVPCLGLCEHAPAMLVQGASVARADKHSYEDLVEGKIRHPRSIVRNEIALLTGNCGKNQVTWLVRYLASGGYAGLRRAFSLKPQGVIEEIKAAGLVGRGGAAFPTGLKWENAAKETKGQKYIVCNANEAEPGSFKDRVLLEDDPHRILEGMLIAAYAIGASKGYIYIRGEYLFQYSVLEQALGEARRAGYLGNNILGSGFDFEIELRRGAGAYVCGEETALLASIEGYRGIPKAKPPFPTQSGLFGCPTVINNVETFANVPFILRVGAEEYRKIGTPYSPGTKLFCLSGDVTLPGLYEVPFGTTFRHLLEQLAGGVRGKKRFQGALFGGAAGAFAGPEDLDVRLTFEDMDAAGLPLGAGVITIFDETRDLRGICLELSKFFAKESCGKCPACLRGTKRQNEILQRITAGGSTSEDLQALQDTAWTQPELSICGLGQSAASAIHSAVRLWPELF